MIDAIEIDETDLETHPNDNEVTEIANSIHNAAYTLYGTNVFDQTVMSPLSPTSVVSKIITSAF